MGKSGGTAGTVGTSRRQRDRRRERQRRRWVPQLQTIRESHQHRYSYNNSSSNGKVTNLGALLAFLPLFVSLMLILKSRNHPWETDFASNKAYTTLPKQTTQYRPVQASLTQRFNLTETTTSKTTLAPERQENDKDDDDNNSFDRSRFRIAYSIAVTSCKKSDGGTNDSIVNVLDGAAVLAHSIRTTLSNGNCSTRYTNYTLIALVYPLAAQACEPLLVRLGYHVILTDVPFRFKDINNFQRYRHYVKQEGCCGAVEFIKLQAYNLTQFDAVVQMDTDLLFIKPMDDVLDAMLIGDTTNVRVLKGRLDPLHHRSQVSSDRPRIDFLYTRDYIQMSRGTKKVHQLAVQGGFFVVRPDTAVLQSLVSIILSGDYHIRYGWKRKYYNGYYGAAQVQGLLSYFYGEEAPPETSLELHPCYYNAMVFGPASKHGTCKYFDNNTAVSPLDCPDCRETSLDEIQSTHFTNCYKPWKCSKHRETTDLCPSTHRLWFEQRRALELSWGYTVPTDGWKFNITQGYCKSSRPGGYVHMTVPER